MYYLGLCIGSLSCDAVVIDDAETILASAVIPTGARNRESIHRVKAEVLQRVKIQETDFAATISTGYGRVFGGKFPEGYRRLAERMGLSGVITELGHVPHDQVLRLSKTAAMLLAINYEGWTTSICKIYEYWAVGGPPVLFLSSRGAGQATD